MDGRAGRYIQQPEGYRAFIPNPLPPNPPLRFDSGLQCLLSDADQVLGRLDGTTGILPNPDLFVAMYVRQEAVLSSQIEGTQASLTDVLRFETGDKTGLRVLDVQEVVNYVHALRYGLNRLKDFPLSLRLIREIHAKLLDGVRGQERLPGEFRTSQNWVGPPGWSINDATHVPPPPHEMKQALGELEHFLHDDTFPALIHAALAHAQFETIHPFLDGNGRVGRLLVTFLLCYRYALERPLLYMSHYLKRHRQEYYDRLQAVRNRGHWEEWIRFFLRGVQEVATEANRTARRILALRKKHRAILDASGAKTPNLLRALDQLFEHPLTTATLLADSLGVTFPTASKLISRMQSAGILEECTGYKRNRRFRYRPYLELFDDSEAAANPDEVLSTPEA